MDFGIPPVVGDPAGMRALAAQLRSKAEQVTHGAADVRGAVGSMSFQGPAATRLRSQTGAWAGRAHATAGDLGEIAALLDRAAARVEHQQDERARTIARLERDMHTRR